MPAIETEFAIVGGGQCGMPLTRALSEAGRRVVLFEREHLGGSCVNFGCTPSKAAIASARLAHQIRRAGEFGLDVGSLEVDFPAVIARARSFADAGRHSLEESLRGHDNPRLIEATARLDGRDGERFRLVAGDQVVLAEQVVLNTGTRSVLPKITGLDPSRCLTAENWLGCDTLPEHLLMLGGSYIGLEMAQFYRRMGSRVTLLTDGGQIAPREDADVAEVLLQAFSDKGIEMRLNADVVRVAHAAGGVTLHLPDGGEVAGSDLFLAVGRIPNLDELGLEKLGMAVPAGKPIKVNERSMTELAGLYATGDIRGGAQFTHSAYDDFLVLRSHFLGDDSRGTRRLIPYGMFTDPELGRVGLNETEARAQAPDARIVRRDFASMGRAREMGQARGFVKLVATADGKRLLGATILGKNGAELVHEMVAMMNSDTDLATFRKGVHIHPTLAEGVHQSVAEICAD